MQMDPAQIFVLVSSGAFDFDTITQENLNELEETMKIFLHYQDSMSSPSYFELVDIITEYNGLHTLQDHRGLCNGPLSLQERPFICYGGMHIKGGVEGAGGPLPCLPLASLSTLPPPCVYLASSLASPLPSLPLLVLSPTQPCT